MSGRLSVRGIAADVQAGRRTAVAVATEALERIAAYDAVQAQAWIERPSTRAVLEAARAVDARIAGGEVLPLAGAPYAVKDNIDVAGSATTAASAGVEPGPAVRNSRQSCRHPSNSARSERLPAGSSSR